MASRLSNSMLPLWAWIIVIIVGSLVVVGTGFLAIRFIVVRRRRATFIETFGDENLPQRRVTVRRGRVVPSSNYLSLTGSRFGLNVLGSEEHDSQSRVGARSRSPFEWWSTLKDRSQSRNSQVTQMTETSSIWTMPTSPNHPRMYQHRNMTFSDASLTSTSKDDEVSTTISEVPPASPPAIYKPPPNFSRSFSNRAHRSGLIPRQLILSRIEESSPHVSMISARRSRIGSYASKSGKLRTSAASSFSLSPSPLRTQFPSPLRSEHSEETSSKPNSIHQDTLPVPTKHLTVPRQENDLAYNSYNPSFADREPTQKLQRMSQVSCDVLSTNFLRPQPSITALPTSTNPDQTSKYWGTKPDPRPVQSNSGKKGRVLRKKSLRRSEMVTQFDS